MQMILDILRGLSCYVLLALAAGAIFWLTIPGFAGPLSSEIKLRALTSVVGGGLSFAAIVFGTLLVLTNRP